MRTLWILIAAVLALAACETASNEPPTDRNELALQAFEANAPEEIRAVYDARSVAEKAQLWRAQFKRSLERADLDAAQRAVLTELGARAEEYLTGGMPEADLARFEAAFEGPLKGEVLERLGATRPASVRIESSDDPVHGYATEGCDTRWCSCCTCCAPPCSVEENWTCGGTCTSSSSGCGALWLQSCTKLCLPGAA